MDASYTVSHETVYRHFVSNEKEANRRLKRALYRAGSSVRMSPSLSDGHQPRALRTPYEPFCSCQVTSDNWGLSEAMYIFGIYRGLSTEVPDRLVHRCLTAAGACCGHSPLSDPRAIQVASAAGFMLAAFFIAADQACARSLSDLGRVLSHCTSRRGFAG